MKPILKTHYNAAELAAMQLEGIPATRENIQRMAERESWPRQKRSGRGGGNEYAPPAAIMEQIRARQAQQLLASAAQLPVPAEVKTLPVKTVRREEQMVLTLTDAQQLRASARKGVLISVEKLMAGCGISKEAALTALLVEAKKEPAGHMAMLLSNAQDERGRRGSELPSVRTIKRWFAQEAEGTLAPKTRQKDMRVPEWASAFLAIWQTPQKPSVELAYHLFAKEWEGDLPSVHQVRRFIAKLGNVSREMGRIGAREIKTIKPYIRRTFEHLWPNDVWSADGHCFDAEVAHPFTGKAFLPEITTIVDIATRRAVGFSIGLAESSFAVLDAIRFAAEHCGIPAIFYVDNGSGYQNDMMKNEATGLMGRLGISIEHSLPYNSQARGVIERLHQTLWIKAAKLLPSYMGHDMDGEAKQRHFKLTRKAIAGKAEQTGLLAWDAFMRLCDDTVAAYNDKPHRSLGGLSPNEAWAQKIAANQLELTLIHSAEIDALFRPRVERVVNRGQVTLFNNVYFSHTLTEFHSETVQVGYDIHNANTAWVYDAEGRFITRAEWNANARDYFPQSVVEQARERRAEGRIKRAEVKIADAHAERHGRQAIEAPEEIVIPGMVGTIRRSELAQRAEALNVQEAEVVEIDTPQMRFARWQRIDAELEAGDPVSEEDKKFWAIYQKSPQWRAFMARQSETAERQLGGIGV